MKPAVLIHLKEKSVRLKSKNFKKLLGIPLYEIAFLKLKKLSKKFDIYVDSSSKFFLTKALKYKFKIIKRPLYLNKPESQGNELIRQCLKVVKNDIIIQYFVTNPFISNKTVNKCATILKINKRFDSITPVRSIFNRFWFKSREVNHKYNKLIGTQFMDPVQVESGIYCFRRESFIKNKSRIAKKNFFLEISEVESFDIDTEIDFKIAEEIAKKELKKLL